MIGSFGTVLAVLLAGALAVGCASVPPRPMPASPGEPNDALTLRVLALGDSYTIGEGVAEAQRWPEQLVARLSGTLDVELEAPQIIARTGWTTDELDAGIDGVGPQGPYDLVTLLIGVNNQYRGLDPEAYRTELVALAERAIGFAGGHAARVVVVSFPDWGASPFAARVGADPAEVAAEVDLFNAIGRAESERLGLAFVDITAYSREIADDPAMFAADGLHPSGAQYAGWVERITPAADAALRTR